MRGAPSGVVCSIMRRNMLRLAQILCAVFTVCAGCAPVRPASTPPPRPVDWGQLLFPRGAAQPPVPATVATAPSREPVEPEAQPVFAPSELAGTDREITEAFPDVASYCEAATRPLAEPPAPSIAPRAKTSCKEIPLGVPFHGDRRFLGLRALRIVTAPDTAYSMLLVHVDRGFVPLAIWWNVDDPSDPGCPSIVRDTGLSRIVIENGLLVIVALGETSTYVEVPENAINDSGQRLRLVRQINIVNGEGPTLHTRTLDAWSGPPLGKKVQPSGTRFVPWDRLLWREWRDFHVQADGTVTIVGAPPET